MKEPQAEVNSSSIEGPVSRLGALEAIKCGLKRKLESSVSQTLSDSEFLKIKPQDIRNNELAESWMTEVWESDSVGFPENIH